MADIDYKAAYERQKLARERAEDALENRSRELYDSKAALEEAYKKLKDQKSQMLHQEKLASIGQLSAGVAHEINNPVGFVKSNLKTLGQYTQDLISLLQLYKETIHPVLESLETENITRLEDECDIDYIIEDIPELLKDSIDGTDRISEIVNELKTFSRVDSDEKEKLDVNRCIENTIKLVNNEIKYKADLEQSLGDIPLTMGYPGSLSQVVLNMLVNASHAITDEQGMGKITIGTSVQDQWILVAIEDNGCGIDEETMNKMFDPFYTTKEVGVGTGLGLSISTGIIKKHGGSIEVSSEVGKGTCFTLRLPVLDVVE